MNRVIFAVGVIYSVSIIHLDMLVFVAMKIESININTPIMTQILCTVSDLKAQDFFNDNMNCVKQVVFITISSTESLLKIT
jgi:hypothetical protein